MGLNSEQKFVALASLISVLVTDPVSPSPWAEKILPAAQTRIGWIPVTSTGMRKGKVAAG